MTCEDLPDDKYFNGGKNGDDGENEPDAIEFFEREDKDASETVFLNEEQGYFLKLILNMVKKDISVSRITLSQNSQKGPFVRSENQVRRILTQLEELKYITLNRGRRGIMPTLNAYKWLDKLK